MLELSPTPTRSPAKSRKLHEWLWDVLTDRWGYRRGFDFKLEEQVRRDFGFLFDNYDAKITLNYYDREHFGNAYIDVEVGPLTFHFLRDRGDSIVYLIDRASPDVSGKYIGISVALGALEMREACDPIPEIPSYIGFEPAAGLIEPKMPELIAAFSETSIKATRMKIDLVSGYYSRQFWERFEKTRKESAAKKKA